MPSNRALLNISESISEDESPKRPESPSQFISNFVNLPAKNTQKKINYFFMPYNHMVELKKSMDFDIDQDQSFNQLCQGMIQKPGLKIEDRNEIRDFVIKMNEIKQNEKLTEGWKKLGHFMLN